MGGVKGAIVLFSEMNKDIGEVDVFFLHLLVMASALFGLSGANEYFHDFENLVGPAHVAIDEVLVVNFQEPMIPLVFLGQPMTVV